MTTQEPTPVIIVSSGSTGLTVVRRVFAVLLLIGAVGILFSVGILQTVNAVVGKPASAIDTGLSIITSPDSAKALSTQLVTQLQKDAGDDTRLAFVEHKDALIAAVGKVIQDPEVRALARADLLRAYDAINTGTKTTIDLKPILTKFTTALHDVDARIPAVPKDFKNTTINIDNKVDYLNMVEQLTVTVWATALVGFALVIVVARFMVRNRTRRVIAVGLATFVPTVLMFSLAAGIGSVPGSLDLKDHEIEVLATALANHIGGVLFGTAVVFLLVSAVTLAAFLLANMRAAKVARSTAPPPPESAAVTQVPGLPEISAQEPVTAADPQVLPPPPLPPASSETEG